MSECKGTTYRTAQLPICLEHQRPYYECDEARLSRENAELRKELEAANKRAVKAERRSRGNADTAYAWKREAEAAESRVKELEAQATGNQYTEGMVQAAESKAATLGRMVGVLREALEDSYRYFTHASKNNLLPEGAVQAVTLAHAALRQTSSPDQFAEEWRLKEADTKRLDALLFEERLDLRHKREDGDWTAGDLETGKTFSADDPRKAIDLFLDALASFQSAQGKEKASG